MGDNDFLIHVASGRFQENSPIGKTLADRPLPLLLFHDHAGLRPDPAYFHWHRRQHDL
jgi:hypothetical protein